MEALQLLSRSEMKQIKGGYMGGGCTLYCCTGGPGSCSDGVECPECSGTTNEECQSSGNGIYECESGYLAALYK